MENFIKIIFKLITTILIVPLIILSPLAIIVFDIAAAEGWSKSIPIAVRIIITIIFLPIILLGFILILIYDEIFINNKVK